MIKRVKDRVKKFFIDQDNIARKTAGLKEKQEAVKRKMEAAMSILNERREKDIPVVLDRRKFAAG